MLEERLSVRLELLPVPAALPVARDRNTAQERLIEIVVVVLRDEVHGIKDMRLAGAVLVNVLREGGIAHFARRCRWSLCVSYCWNSCGQETHQENSAALP